MLMKIDYSVETNLNRAQLFVLMTLKIQRKISYI